jgi:hypothetical protein
VVVTRRSGKAGRLTCAAEIDIAFNRHIFPDLLDSVACY